MLFNSYEFFVFLGFFYAAFLVLRKCLTARNTLLLCASYVFYGWWDWRFLSLIALSTLVDYGVGLALRRRFEEDQPRRGWDRACLALSVSVNLGLLGVFKYYDFFVVSLVESAEAVGVSLDVAVLNIVLPVGISFYTFQTMSYTIDVFRRKAEPESNLLTFATYVAYFPQLVAGPIERASSLLPQFRRVLPLSLSSVQVGLYLILFGLFKKVVLADNAADIVNTVFTPDGGLASNVSGWETMIAIYAFAIQIYCDFSGYSDIARGLGKMMGIDIMVNFSMPYLARGPREFWRCWHISLSTWLRDYLYIPLGGNRRGPLRTYINLFTTMLLGGLWHGAAWTFVAWGALHGLYLAAYRLGEQFWPKHAETRPAPAALLIGVMQAALFFHLTCLAWVFFRADTFAVASEAITRVLQFLSGGWLDVLRVRGRMTLGEEQLAIFAIVAGCVVLGHFVGRVWNPYVFVRGHWTLRGLWYAVLALGILFFGVRGGEQFIYFEF
ncbi:MAG: MBOAT family protein [Planctomycetota bacterium]